MQTVISQIKVPGCGFEAACRLWFRLFIIYFRIPIFFQMWKKKFAFLCENTPPKSCHVRTRQPVLIFKIIFVCLKIMKMQHQEGSGMSFTKQLDVLRVVICDCVCVFSLLNIFFWKQTHLLGMLANKKNAQEFPGGPGWLGFWAFCCSLGSISGQGIEIPQTAWLKKKKKTLSWENNYFVLL